MDIACLDVPPGTIALCPLPGRDGAWQDDVAAIAQFAPALILSLTEPGESPRDLLQGLRIGGAMVLRFAIPDYGTPAPQADWKALSVAAHKALDAGLRVLVHCHGGRGRSGMIALRLMIERGENPDAALMRLRQHRPGAVETDAQEVWARHGPGADTLRHINAP